MLRIILEPLALFLSPFAVYALFMLASPGGIGKDKAWSLRHVSVLTLAGLSAAFIGLIVFGVTAERHLGAYTPAHVENGRLVPGHLD